MLTDKNKVKAIEGTEKLREKAETLSDPLVREEIQNEIDPERLKSKFEQLLRVLPDVLVRSGEPWERTEVLDLSGKSFTVRRKYEYLGTEKRGEKDLDKISCRILDAKYDQDPNSKLPLKVVKSDLKVESSEGRILFDRDGGFIVHAPARRSGSKAI